MELYESIKLLTQGLAEFAEACGALVITYAVVRALIGFAANVVRGPSASVPVAAIRLGLGRALTLALEFLVAADILRTAVAPSWADIAMLAAIVAIRTLLNFFLDKELERAEVRQERAEERPAAGARAA